MKHVLVVEDNSILYMRMKDFLTERLFSVDEYTPSAEEALDRIKVRRPDIALLDIRLKGEMTGIDLGKLLSERYKIPFIYITKLADYDTFHKGLATNHEHYFVKTKPVLDENEVYRAIQTALKRYEKSVIKKKGVEGLINYRKEIKDYSSNRITRIPVDYKDIAFFTTDSFDKDKMKILKPNYLWFLARNNERLFLNMTLKEIYDTLPENFIKISDNAIIILSTDFFDGRINGNFISVKGRVFRIGRTYKKRVERVIKERYGK